MRFSTATFIVVLFVLQTVQGAEPGSLKPGSLKPGSLKPGAPNLPPQIFAVVGEETSVYFENLVVDKALRPESVQCELGEAESRRWTIRPTAAQIGSHSLKLTFGEIRAVKRSDLETELVIVPSSKGTAPRILVVGDSLTHASHFPNELFRLYREHHDTPLVMLGTHHPAAAKDGVQHEGYGGWTWQRFLEKYSPDQAGNSRKVSSPFVYLSSSQKPQLDVSEYVRRECGNQPPDIVFFKLGINDCFSAPADDLAGIDARIDTVFQIADKLLAGFRTAMPKADFAICLTTPGNDRQTAYATNYKGRYPRDGWNKIQHRLVQRQLAHFGERQSEGLFIVPTHVNLDVVSGYPDNNAVHPNVVGYHQIAMSLYTWLEWRQNSR